MTGINKKRKEVATLANRLNKKLHDLSAAFRRAREIVKGREVVSKVAGVTYGNRQRALGRLERYAAHAVNVTLEREAGNAYDANAVKVMVSVGDGGQYHLGYVTNDLAALIAPVLDISDISPDKCDRLS